MLRKFLLIDYPNFLSFLHFPFIFNYGRNNHTNLIFYFRDGNRKLPCLVNDESNERGYYFPKKGVRDIFSQENFHITSLTFRTFFFFFNNDQHLKNIFILQNLQRN